MLCSRCYSEGCRVSIHSVAMLPLDAWFGPGYLASSEVWLRLWNCRGGGICWGLISCRSWLSPQREESIVGETCFWGQCSPAGGVGKLFCKGSGVKYYRLVDQVDFVATTHLCCCSRKTGKDNTSANGCVPIKLSFQNQVVPVVGPQSGLPTLFRAWRVADMIDKNNFLICNPLDHTLYRWSCFS